MTERQDAGRADRWYGTGEDGFGKLFRVWGQEEPKNVAGIPLRRAHGGTSLEFNQDPSMPQRLARNLSGPQRFRRQIDPRTLAATQHGVTWSGVNYYLTQPQYAWSGRTWADHNDPANREPVIWSSPDQGPVILTGHHRTITALLRGVPVEAVWVETAELSLAPGTRVTPLIWVGDCPYPHIKVASASEAEPLIRNGTRCVLPEVGQAEELLKRVGTDPAWIRTAVTFATTGRVA